MARARLMGAVSPDEIYRSPELANPPEPPAPEGFLLSAARHGSLKYRRKPKRETRIPGLARRTRVPKSAGPAGGNEAMSRTPMAERTLRSSQIAAHLRRGRNLVCRKSSCGSTDAGGEDVGYFASTGKAGSIPAFDARTVEVPRQGLPRATAQVRRKEACVAVTDADIACSPAYPSNGRSSGRPGGGEDVCYFGKERRPLCGPEVRVQGPPAAMP